MVRDTKGSQGPLPRGRRHDRALYRGRAARALIAGAIWLTAAPAFAIHGTVQDTEGRGVAEALVCYIDGDQIRRCVGTDGDGGFEMPDMRLDTLRITAEGFLVGTASTSGLDQPIVLERAPSLFVRLLDASGGEPIDSAKLFVVYPSGREIGPFPVNRAGLRVQRVLRPGTVRLRVEAPGYDPGRPREAELVGGKETEIELRLEPDSGESDP